MSRKKRYGSLSYRGTNKHRMHKKPAPARYKLSDLKAQAALLRAVAVEEKWTARQYVDALRSMTRKAARHYGE